MNAPSSPSQPPDKELALADTGKKGTRGVFLAVLFGLCALLATSLDSLYVWKEMGHIAISLHGWLALAAGGLGTVLLGSGLMALSFYSSRSGHDEQVRDEATRLESAHLNSPDFNSTSRNSPGRNSQPEDKDL